MPAARSTSASSAPRPKRWGSPLSEAHHRLALASRGNHPAVNLVLGHFPTIVRMSQRHLLGRRRGVAQQQRIDQVVVEHHVGLGQAFGAPDGDESRIARSGSHQVDLAYTSARYVVHRTSSYLSGLWLPGGPDNLEALPTACSTSTREGYQTWPAKGCIDASPLGQEPNRCPLTPDLYYHSRLHRGLSMALFPASVVLALARRDRAGLIRRGRVPGCRSMSPSHPGTAGGASYGRRDVIRGSEPGLG